MTVKINYKGQDIKLNEHSHDEKVEELPSVEFDSNGEKIYCSHSMLIEALRSYLAHAKNNGRNVFDERVN